MKLLVVVSACVLLAISGVDARPPRARPSESFAELVANRTAEMASRDENPTTIAMLAYKSSSMFLAAMRLNIRLPAKRTLTDVTYQATRFLTPDRALDDIAELEKGVIKRLSDVDNNRPVDASAETNKLIDDFVAENTELAAKQFESMHALSVKATEEAEPVSQKLIALIDALAEKIDACLQVKIIDFRQLFQCNRDYRALENQIAPENAELRSQSDKLYSEYYNEWNEFQSQLNAKIEELRKQVFNPQQN